MKNSEASVSRPGISNLFDFGGFTRFLRANFLQNSSDDGDTSGFTTARLASRQQVPNRDYPSQCLLRVVFILSHGSRLPRYGKFFQHTDACGYDLSAVVLVLFPFPSTHEIQVEYRKLQQVPTLLYSTSHWR